MKTPNTSQIVVRVPDVLRGRLVEAAGDHETISMVVRRILQRYFAKRGAA